MAIERKKRMVITNPDEPRAGDYAYQFYDKSHPLRGEPEVIERLRKNLRGLRGDTVTMTFRGEHIGDRGSKKFTVRRTFKLNKYSDVFGPGSAFASAIHWVRDKYSDETLVVHNFMIEEADFDDEDSEDDEA